MKLVPLVAVLAAVAAASAERLVCYYTNWSRYGGEPFQVENINATLCTHFVYAFLGLKDSGVIVSVDPWNDLGDEWTVGGLSRFQKLKRGNPSAKVLLGVGGWSQGASNFQQVLRSAEKRKVFLESAVEFVQRYGFDGLEVDLVYQDSWGGTPADREGLSELLKEMRAAFQPRGFVLSLSTSAHPRVFDNSYHIANLTRHADFVNVMAYDLHGSWDGKTGHVAPLHPLKTESADERQSNVEAVINRYIAKGAIAEKLVLGVVSYGRTFTLVTPENKGLNAPARGPGRVEPLPYRTFCSQDNGRLWEKFRSEEQKVPYAVSGDQWVGYEDVESLREKVKLSKAKKLGGVSFWSLDMDDFKGNCGSGKFPLLRAVKAEMSKTKKDFSEFAENFEGDLRLTETKMAALEGVGALNKSKPANIKLFIDRYLSYTHSDHVIV